jgi:RNA polymerase sigma-70 factor, ECF subfamily
VKTELLDKIKQGDPEAFEVVYKTYYSQLRKFAIKFVKSNDAAEDMVQNVFLNIWKNHETWEVKGEIGSYLFGAVRNQALNYLKQQRISNEYLNKMEFIEAAPELSADQEYMLSEIQHALEKSIEKLPEKCRLIFTMNRQLGLKYSQIAELLGISIKTVETQMSRAVKSIRKLLTPFISIFF